MTDYEREMLRLVEMVVSVEPWWQPMINPKVLKAEKAAQAVLERWNWKHPMTDHERKIVNAADGSGSRELVVRTAKGEWVLDGGRADCVHSIIRTVMAAAAPWLLRNAVQRARSGDASSLWIVTKLGEDMKRLMDERDERWLADAKAELADATDRPF